MDDETKFLVDTNQANLARIIGFVGIIDAKAKFLLTLILALASYLVAQLGSYVDAHARWQTMPNWARFFGRGALKNGGSDGSPFDTSVHTSYDANGFKKGPSTACSAFLT